MNDVYQTNDNDKCDRSDYTKCASMNRLITALKHYSKFKVIDKAADQEIFCSFMNETYVSFINDHIHFTQYHQHHLERMNEDLIKDDTFHSCKLETCAHTMRHQKIHQSTSHTALISDSRLNFYIQKLDSFHFHVLHCFEVGLRSNISADNHTNQQQDDNHFDDAFAAIRHEIAERQHMTASFNRFSSNNDKYNIVTQRTNKAQAMYMDHVVKHLIRIDTPDVKIKAFLDAIQAQHYDSDSFQHDQTFRPNGNLSKYIDIASSSTASFSIGLRYYYWSYYQNVKATNDELWDYNRNDHSGYDIKELYVTPKYSSFKDEIAHYESINLEDYQFICVKLKQYEQTKTIKRTTATYAADRFHYGIQNGESIHCRHLLALVLYTDYSKLCSDFSATFRKMEPFETVQSMIKRHRMYYWMSKCLRECVEIYGQSRLGDTRYNNDNDDDGVSILKGPFYSGMSVVMDMPSFNVRLCSPTSTSRQIAVAVKFCGDDGMIIELDNPLTAQYKYLHGFNASWVSRFPEEDEVLFIGGAEWLKIQTVRMIKTQQNFKQLACSLYYVDVMLTGGEITNDLSINKAHVALIEGLMNVRLNKGMTRAVFDKYMVSTFDAFVTHKRQIVLRLFRLYDADSEMRGLWMNNMDKRQHNTEHVQMREDKDETNLFKPEMLQIFGNVETIVIQSTIPTGRCSWSLSMFALLSLIVSIKSAVNKIVIKAVTDMFNGSNWIKDAWASSQKRLIEAYQDKNYRIVMKEVNFGYPSYWFEITKIE